MNLISYNDFHALKGPLNIFLLRLPEIFCSYVSRFKKKLLFDAWSISSRQYAEDFIRVLFLGKNEIDKNYFCKLIFNKNCNELYLGKVGIWRLLFYFWKRNKTYDLIIVKSKMKLCNLLKSSSNFVVPAWIGCEIDLCCDIERQGMSKRTLKNNLRKIKRGNFSYCITKDPADFHFFYHNMHLPYISKRHTDSAFKSSYRELKKSFENGELLQIKEGQKIVAAVIIDYKMMNGIPRITKLGVLEGDFEFVKKGALLALYYYTIQYLKESNHEKVNLGITRPFFSDGVLQHKLNWGAKIVCETSNAFLLSLLSKKKGLKSFLSYNPFILKNGNSLTLATFSDPGSKECPYFSESENKLKLCGIDDRTSFSL